MSQTALIRANVSYDMSGFSTSLLLKCHSISVTNTGVNERCVCNNGRVGHYCEFDKPCSMLATEKAEKIGTNCLGR